jgi:hydrogenase maturation protease
MTGRVLVAGVGNIFLGDDGFGPEVARRLAGVALPAQVRVADFGIRGIHLAYELLDGYTALVLIDTVPPQGRPGRLHVLDASDVDRPGGQVDAHSMDPAAMLGTLDRLGGTLPKTIVVGCEPESVAEGIGLSAPVAAAVDAAVEQVLAVVESLQDDLEARSAR